MSVFNALTGQVLGTESALSGLKKDLKSDLLSALVSAAAFGAAILCLGWAAYGALLTYGLSQPESAAVIGGGLALLGFVILRRGSAAAEAVDAPESGQSMSDDPTAALKAQLAIVATDLALSFLEGMQTPPKNTVDDKPCAPEKTDL